MTERDEPERPRGLRGMRGLGRRAGAWLLFLPVLIAVLLLLYLFISAGATLLEGS